MLFTNHRSLERIYICLVVLSSFIIQNRAESIPDLSWYNQQVSKTVVPPYREAYVTLHEKIVQKLLNVNVDIDETEMKPFIQSLACGSRTVQQQLTSAADASEQIRVKVDADILTLTLSINVQENEVHQSQLAVNVALANIQSAQQQVNAAETAVRERETALQSAEHRLHEAEKEVEKARRCGVRRRRKRGFGRWWRKHVEKPVVQAVRHVVIKPVCSVVNSGGIDNAKSTRHMAAHTLNEARDRLNHFQQVLANQRNQHTQAQNALHAANHRLQTLTNLLNEHKNKQQLMGHLVKRIRDVEIHVKEVLDSSVVLSTTISELVDFNLVIEPLNSISLEMINNQIMASFQYGISADMATTVKNNLNILNEKLPLMPFNDVINNQNIVCN